MTAEAFRKYFPVWLLYVGTGRQFLPDEGGLNDQDQNAMKVIMELDTLYDKITGQIKEQRKDSDAS